MKTEKKRKETAGKQGMKFSPYLWGGLVHNCSRLPEYEPIFKENPHLHYIAEVKLYSFGNMPSDDRCLGTHASHRVVRFLNHLLILVITLFTVTLSTD